MKVCIFGLGEAGSLFAADLVAAGVDVVAYDPADVGTPAGVERFVHPALAVNGAAAVVALTAATDARLAMLQALDAIASTSFYADLSTAAPAVKAQLAQIAEDRELDFADVALMSMVPGEGLATPSIAAGTGAKRYAALVNGLRGNVQVSDRPAGGAAAKKLLRSVMMKGTAAVVVEAVRAGAAADDLEWLWENLVDEITGADRRWLERMVTGSVTHGVRRRHEMEDARSMLAELGIEPIMTSATIEALARIGDMDIPDLPGATEVPEPPAPDFGTTVNVPAPVEAPSS